jgi:hypothetical protein
VQQDLQTKQKPWANRHQAALKVDEAAPRQEPARPALKLGNGDLWRDRQLRDYRKANGLCFRCGNKFDQNHQCAKKAEVHMISSDDHRAKISEEVLELLELQDLANAQELSLSVNAISGSQTDGTICIQALVQNQVMLLLVDSVIHLSMRILQDVYSAPLYQFQQFW